MTRRSYISASMLVVVAMFAMALVQAEAQSASLTGIVRDSHGTPQSGASVELLRPDFSVALQAYTDDHGRYRISSILPGVYAVKASADLFLPTLRENLRVVGESKLVVNLTLDTLYEAFRWLPAKPRQVDEPKDDWTWTLRLSANRPLLRLLEDGPLVVVSNGDGTTPELKARVTVRGGDGGFGEGGIHNDFEMERSPGDARAMIFRADLTQAGDAALNAMVGYEQQLAQGHTFRTITAIEDRPDIGGGPGIAVLERTVAGCRDAGALVLLDVKRGDIGSTMRGYADAYLDPSSPLAVDAVTLSPFLGFGSLRPALDVASSHGAGVFVLALTSNPEAAQVQRASTGSGTVVGDLLAAVRAENDGAHPLGSVGAVIGATVSDLGADADVNGPILAPGYGAQGGTVADLRRLFGSAWHAVLPSTSRAVLAAGPSVQALRDAANRCRDELS